MFGIGKPKPEVDEKKQQELERQKNAAKQMLQDMHGVGPEEAARMVERIKTFLQNDKTLPFNIRQKIGTRMRELECEANMRAADKLLHQAMELMDASQLRERGQKLAEARRYFSKVCTLGGDSEWKKAFQRVCENIMMSGGVRFDAPSRAKPLDTAPKAPNRAKGDS
jgi:hypothetical protein